MTQWILARSEGIVPASGRPVGWVPTRDELDLLDTDGCDDIQELLSSPTEFWREEVEEMRNYFSKQVGTSLPKEMWDQLDNLEKRIDLFEDFM